MKTRITAIALALVSMSTFAQPGGTHAGGMYGDRTLSGEKAGEPVFSTASSTTRAQVRAELMEHLARVDRNRSGEKAGEPVYSPTSQRTRAEVSAEVAAAVARGVRLSNGEASYRQ